MMVCLLFQHIEFAGLVDLESINQRGIGNKSATACSGRKGATAAQPLICHPLWLLDSCGSQPCRHSTMHSIEHTSERRSRFRCKAGGIETWHGVSRAPTLNRSLSF